MKIATLWFEVIAYAPAHILMMTSQPNANLTLTKNDTKCGPQNPNDILVFAACRKGRHVAGTTMRLGPLKHASP